ncbi:MAG: hypothetical protein LBK60_00555, partial [Verrucomicrobiales bacterium]|nr:hypothetical protein [Verrucomicrobiales bacterium]
RHQASGIRHQASGIRHQASGIRHQASGIRHQASGIRHQALRPEAQRQHFFPAFIFNQFNTGSACSQALPVFLLTPNKDIWHENQ